MSNSHVIIGVHGLANKPPKATLRDWWAKSIVEGLARNQRRTSEELDFEIVYWADWRYDRPIANEKNDEPYLRADGDRRLPTYEDGWRDDVIAGFGDLFGKPLDWAKRYFGVDEIAGLVLGAKLEDLALYYDDEAKRELLRARLRKALVANAGKRIMVIAHSMGSIIAYDVLRRLGRDDPSFRVEHLITIGSPLGLPHVKYKIYEENDQVRTPSVVARWSNLADRRDPVAADVHLAGDYAPNAAGVEVRDDLVINGYRGKKGDANHHKSYGYLRTPEISKLIRGFI